MKRQLAETAVALVLLAGTMALVAWRAYELGGIDERMLGAIICEPMQDTVYVHPVRP